MSVIHTGQIPHIALYIMLALSLKPRHGYEIMQQITQDTEGHVKVGAGTLYGSIKQLLASNLIEEIPFSASPRRKQYRLTRKGWDMLTAELKHYDHLIELAKARRAL